MNEKIAFLKDKLFKLDITEPVTLNDDIGYDTQSRLIGYYHPTNKRFVLSREKSNSILHRIRQVSNVNQIPDDDAEPIAKLLYDWLKGKLECKIECLTIWNEDTNNMVSYSPAGHE